jgi:hypothetical protein
VQERIVLGEIGFSLTSRFADKAVNAILENLFGR